MRSDVPTMKLERLLLFTLILSQIGQVTSILCTIRCPFVFLTFNMTLEHRICPRNATSEFGSCLLIVELDFVGPGGIASLELDDQTSETSLTIQTNFGIRNNVTATTIVYRCSTTDDCAWDFTQKLFGAKLAEFDAFSARAKIAELLSSPTVPDPVKCANRVCPSGQLCVGTLDGVASTSDASFQVKSQSQCTPRAADTDMFYIDEKITFPYITTTHFNISCDQNRCNNIETIMSVYQIYKSDYILPLNYSFLPMNATDLTTTPPTSAATSYRLSHLLTMLIINVCSYLFIFIFSTMK